MKITIATDKAPAAIGPYSQGVAAGGFVYTSGQLPIDISTGIMEEADIKKATANCLNNVAAILAAGGASMEQVVKTTIFLSDMNDFTDVNEAYGAFFKNDPPSRSCVQVARLPKNARIEIEAVAYRD